MIVFQRSWVGLRLVICIVVFSGGWLFLAALTDNVTYTTGGSTHWRSGASSGPYHRGGPIRRLAVGILGGAILWIGYGIFRMKSELLIDKANNRIASRIKFTVWELRKDFPIDVFSKILLPSQAKTPLPGQYIFLSDGAGAFKGRFIIAGTFLTFEEAYRKASELASILGIPIDDRSKE